MKLQMAITLDVTCLDEDGAAVPPPAPGTLDRAELAHSVVSAVRHALAHAQGVGFTHDLASTTSILVADVSAPVEPPPDPGRPFNDATALAVRNVVFALVRELGHLNDLEKTAAFVELDGHMRAAAERRLTNVVSDACRLAVKGDPGLSGGICRWFPILRYFRSPETGRWWSD